MNRDWGSTMFYALSFAILLATSAPSEELITGYYFACSATLKLSRGTITVQRSLREDAQALYESDTGYWEPADRRSGYIRWSSVPGRGASRLSDNLASYTMFVRTDRRLPKVASWELAGTGLAGYDSFSVPMTTGADPRQGQAGMPLRVLLAFAGSQENISWSVMDVRSRPDGTRTKYADGILDAAALREAADAAPKAEALLNTMAAAPAQQCQRTPIYYDPNAEI